MNVQIGAAAAMGPRCWGCSVRNPLGLLILRLLTIPMTGVMLLQCIRFRLGGRNRDGRGAAHSMIVSGLVSAALIVVVV
jgi:hypothetical protein